MAIPFMAGAAAAGGLLSYFGQRSANARNIALAREQMRFQERMSNTQFQRRMRDLRKAGVNPLLAVSQGGASSPAGQTARVESAEGSGVTSAMRALQTMAQTQQLEAAARLQTTSARVAGEGLREVTFQPEAGGRPQQMSIIAARMLSEMERNVSTAVQSKAQAQVTRVLEQLRRNEIPGSEVMAEFYKNVGQVAPWLRNMLPALRELLRLVRPR